MHYNGDFPLFAIPFIILMMAGMGLMMWLMMRMMMGGHSGGHDMGDHEGDNDRDADQIRSLRDEIASLRRDLESRHAEGGGPSGGDTPKAGG